MNHHECGATVKRCTHCETVKDDAQFYFSGKGYRIQPCKVCMVEKNRLNKQRHFSKPGAKEKKAASDRRWRESNKDRVAAAKRQQYRRDPKAARERQRRWERKNPHMAAFYLAQRRAREKQAIPPWADMERVRNMYREAKRLSEETGIPHEVDHIIPLVAKRDYVHIASGLHCHTNMQIVPRRANRRKAFNFD